MLRRRAMCSVAKKLLREDGAELWRRGQDGKVGPELFTQLEAARRGSQEVRSNLAVTLAARWHVDQVAAQKKDENIVATYALRVKQRDDPREDQPDVDVGLLCASIWPEGPDGIKTALLFSLQSDPALPLGLAAYPLIAHARKLLTSKDIGVERVLAIAALPGLCQWIKEERAWERIDEKNHGSNEYHWVQQRAAVEKVALFDEEKGRPSDAAYAEAKGALEGLAMEYAAIEDVEAETTAYALAGGRLVGIHYMHDTSEDALKAAAGCTASYEFDTEEIRHIDLDDKLEDHTAHTPHPAEGHPGRW